MPKRHMSNPNDKEDEHEEYDDEEYQIGDELKENKKKNRKKRPKLKLANAPVVNSISDLIDISKTSLYYKNLDVMVLWRITPYLEELNNMIGMKSLKESVFFQILYYLQNMHYRNQNEEYLHTIILGEPGTGKTTVSKIIGKIYQEMGILSEEGTFKIAYRDDFIAEYLGQTAIKTRKLLKSCIGGVLFIDEVYSLGPTSDDRDSFSKEALDTLTAFLSEHRNDFCCIAAGYEEDIKKCFFGNNRGLERRFPWVHKIDPYVPEELTEILIKMIYDINWETNVSKNEIIEIIAANKNLFKFAGGDIETFITRCKMAHSRRVFNLGNKHKFILTKEDLLSAVETIKKNSLNKEEKEDNISFMRMYM